jgi:hypothetical protein
MVRECRHYYYRVVQEAVFLESYVETKSPLNNIEAVRQHLTNLGMRHGKEPHRC